MRVSFDFSKQQLKLETTRLTHLHHSFSLLMYISRQNIE